MIEWLRSLFGVQTSSAVAKERLRLVLLSDHLALSPDIIEELRRDLLEVISRYVEVDEQNSDVSFEHKEQGIAMLANFPVLSLKDRPPAPPPSSPADEETSVLSAVGTNGHSDAEPPVSHNHAARPPRRKRKRKNSGATVTQTAPAQ